jgi:putative ABC transport system permease protein
MNDLRFAIRQLLKNPGFTIVAVLTLALGMGANTAIFSLVNAIMLRPPPFPEPERLMYLSERSPDLEAMSISYPNLVDWQKQSATFENIAGFRTEGYNLTGGELPERVQGFRVSANFFATLGVVPLHGRTFRPDEDQPSAPRVVIISEGLWQRRFGRDLTILGRPVQLDAESHVVIGIMPAAFQFPREVELWTPLGVLGGMSSWKNRGNHPGIYAIARLKPGVTAEQARADMDTITSRLAQQYPDTNARSGASVMTLRERMVQQPRPALLMLLGAVGFVLLIACANLANLLMARSAARAKEIAIRSALGAGRGRIIRQLLCESLMLSSLGAMAGLLLAFWGVGLLRQMIPAELQESIDITVDAIVLQFTAVLALLTALGFGLVPALQSSKPDLNETLKEGGRGAGEGRRPHRLRHALIISETALAMVLLVGASLLIRSFDRAQKVSSGLNPVGVFTTSFSLPILKYKERRDQLAFFKKLLERVSALPGIQGAAGTRTLLGGSQIIYRVEGEAAPEPGRSPVCDFSAVSPDYFNVMGIRLLTGRAFTPADDQKAPRVAVIDEKFARKHRKNGDAIGKRISTGDADTWLTIVGVVGHVKNYGIDRHSRQELYLPFAQQPSSTMTLVVKAGNASAVAGIRAAVREIDPDQPLTTIRPMEQILADQVAPRRITMLLLAVFSGLALALAAVGIYGVMAYNASQRTREIGVRMALGARSVDVLMMVLRQSARPVLVGAGLGLVSALALTRLMVTLLFGVSTLDPITYTLMPVTLLAVAFVASYLPARRAANVDPMEALRYE